MMHDKNVNEIYDQHQKTTPRKKSFPYSDSYLVVFSDTFLDSCLCGRNKRGSIDAEVIFEREDSETYPEGDKVCNGKDLHTPEEYSQSEDLARCCTISYNCNENYCASIDIDGTTQQDEYIIELHGNEEEKYSMKLRERLPLDEEFHKEEAKQQLCEIYDEASNLFKQFNNIIGDLSQEIALLLAGSNQTSMEFVKKLLNMECFKKVISMCASTRAELKHAQNLLYEKIDLMSNDFLASEKSLFQDVDIPVDFDIRDVYEESIVSFIIDFTLLESKGLILLPWQARRFVFLLSSVWNRRLVTIQELLFAIKRQSYVSPSIISVFNWGNDQKKLKNTIKVDLGIFNEGHPRLETGVSGTVIPVKDDQLSTIIAYSLSSFGYKSIFKRYSNLFTPKSSHNINSISERILLRMRDQGKSHIKHKFYDVNTRDRKQTFKFVCTSYFATQFAAIREAYLSPSMVNDKNYSIDKDKSTELDFEDGYICSLFSSSSFSPRGGKSSASFSKTGDERFVMKHITRNELKMFLEFAPNYFIYLSEAFSNSSPTILGKIMGVYQIGYYDFVSGKQIMDQVIIMENIFYNRTLTKIFDLKGNIRRFASWLNDGESNTNQIIASLNRKNSDSSKSETLMDLDEVCDDDCTIDSSSNNSTSSAELKYSAIVLPDSTLLDGDFLEYKVNCSLILDDVAKDILHKSVLNDASFLSSINVLDYSVLVGIDEENKQCVFGIIDFIRQYDFYEQVEQAGKSLYMAVGGIGDSPTVIHPSRYKDRFTTAIEQYFMIDEENSNVEAASWREMKFEFDQL